MVITTVSNRPRIWSSFPNIHRDVPQSKKMNGTEDVISYGDFHNSYNSPTFGRRTNVSNYDFPEKSPKKDKKWSLGNLFRRKKKTVSDSSSDEEAQKKGFLQKKRKPEKRKKPAKTVGTFDHVVLSPRNSFYPENKREIEGVFSDPAISYSSYSKRALPKAPSESENRLVINSKESLKSSSPSFYQGSIDKKSLRVLTKAKVEHERVTKYGSSSDEDSQRSLSSSRIRSDDSSTRLHREGSLSRRSRAARTERYLKRHSKDEENLNHLRVSKSDAEARYLAHYSEHNYLKRPLPRSPVNKHKTGSSTKSTNDFSGLSTIPPSHATNSRYKLSNTTSNSSLKGPGSYDSYTKNCNDCPNQRSVSYDGNIHKSYDAQLSVSRKYNHINNSNLMDAYNNNHQKQPPPPPPRDPRRMNVFQYFDNGRPTSYSFENGYHARNTHQGLKSKSFNKPEADSAVDQNRTHSFNYRSTSEDQLPVQPLLHDQLIPRPSSATPEMCAQQRHSRRYPDAPENYNYLMDKHPRSRKPIFIQSQVNNPHKTMSHKSAEFWRQKEQEELKRVEKQQVPPESPTIFTSQTHVSTKVFLPSVTDNNSKGRERSPFKSHSPIVNEGSAFTPVKKIETNESIKPENSKSKSSNLEEALDELEAIYNSLQLGDEHLLDRAEEREKSAAAKKALEAKEKYPTSPMTDNYESFDSVDNPRRKRHLRRSRVVDIKADDMAFRKLNKERSQTVSDPQSVMSKVSYLLSSPVYNPHEDDVVEHKGKSKEPSVTLDDVVYRSVKHANNSLKIVEPQPPFGIPLGPVAPAANSDYLHAVPEHTGRPAFKPRKIPNIVNDDLAFRNLRKDGNKEPALPPVSGEDFVNNNSYNKSLAKKNRAVRSLSANIFNYAPSDSDHENEFASGKLDDIADAMEIARQVLKEKENRINATKRGFLSDTDATRIHPKSHSAAKSINNNRTNFLNQLRFGLESNCDNGDVQQKLQIRVPFLGDDFVHSKPPRGLTPERKSRSPTKESTPIPLSHFEEPSTNTYVNTSFDDMLAALAIEAKETSDRITSELNQLVEEKEKKVNEEPKQEPSKLDISKELSEIDAVSERAKLCEKILESSKEDLTLSSDAETVEETECLAANDEVSTTINEAIKKCEDVAPTAEPESDHDYENLVSEKEDEVSNAVDAVAEEQCEVFDAKAEETSAVEQPEGVTDTNCVGDGGEGAL